MVRTVAYFQVDAFTTQPYSGIPVGVVTQAMSLSDEEMQLIALELNLSDTVYVLPSIHLEQAYNRLRHYKRFGEIPFSETTTLASTWVLVTEKWLPVPMNGSFFSRIEHPPDSTIPVEVRCKDGDLMLVMVSTVLPELVSPPKEMIDAVMAALALNQSDLNSSFDILLAHDFGYLLLPLRSKETLVAIEPKRDILTRLYEKYQMCPTPFSLQLSDKKLYVNQRSLAGYDRNQLETLNCSAATSVAHYCFDQKIRFTENGKIEILVNQGSKRERQAQFYCELFIKDGLATSIKIGGAAVISMTGKLILPE